MALMSLNICAFNTRNKDCFAANNHIMASDGVMKTLKSHPLDGRLLSLKPSQDERDRTMK